MSISFGSGGGFTGAYNEFILNGKGNLSSIKAFTSDTSLIKKIDNKTLKKIFKALESKAIKNTTLNQSGNMNSFIKFYSNNKLIHSYQWADGAIPPQEIKDLYQTLNTLTQP